MKIVGKKLEDIASAEKNTSDKDLFGRSAFNRYYYAAFLVTRDMLGLIDPRWKYVPHKNIPELLCMAVRKPIINHLKVGVTKGLVGKGESSNTRTRLNIATLGLAELLKFAYDIRVIADYEPESKITEHKKIITLRTCTATSANGWVNRAESYCKTIIKIYKDSGIV